MRGYSQTIIDKNNTAPAGNLGVKLGKVCIPRGITVTFLANYFGVTRPTIYAWFSGEKAPRQSQAAKIEVFLEHLGE